MIETFVLLLAAHVLADFLLQSTAMVREKRRPRVLLMHVAIHLAASIVLLGTWHPGLAGLAAAHLAIDAAKSRLRLDTLRWFLIDQAAHLATIALAALAIPGLWASSYWPALLPQGLSQALPAIWLYISGLVVAVRAGGFAVALLLGPYLRTTPALTQGSLPGAGALIGQLERAATYLMILLGQPTAVAFLVAAKSVLRFATARDDRKISEYIIAGTLASIGWALLTAILVQVLADALQGGMP